MENANLFSSDLYFKDPYVAARKQLDKGWYPLGIKYFVLALTERD